MATMKAGATAQRRLHYVGQRLDGTHLVNGNQTGVWRVVVVKELHPSDKSQLLVHYEGLEDKYDEWMDKYRQIAPLGTHTGVAAAPSVGEVKPESDNVGTGRDASVGGSAPDSRFVTRRQEAKRAVRTPRPGAQAAINPLPQTRGLASRHPSAGPQPAGPGHGGMGRHHDKDLLSGLYTDGSMAAKMRKYEAVEKTRDMLERREEGKSATSSRGRHVEMIKSKKKKEKKKRGAASGRVQREESDRWITVDDIRHRAAGQAEDSAFGRTGQERNMDGMLRQYKHRPYCCIAVFVLHGLFLALGLALNTPKAYRMEPLTGRNGTRTGNIWLGPKIKVLERIGAKRWDLISSGGIWRLAVSMWIPAGLLHYVANMLVLVKVMCEPETRFGYRRIAPIYVVSGLVGTIASCLFVPTATTLEMSAARSGMLGACFGDLVQNWDMYKGSGRKHEIFGLLGVVAFCIPMMIMPFDDPFADVAGFLVGFLLGLVILPLRRRHRDGSGKSRHPAVQCLRCLACCLVIGLALLAVVAIIAGTGNKRTWCPFCLDVTCLHLGVPAKGKSAPAWVCPVAPDVSAMDVTPVNVTTNFGQ